MLPLIPLATLAISQGPSLIRGIASMFGDGQAAQTATAVADAVESIGKLGLTKDQQSAALAGQLSAMPPTSQLDFAKLQVELEKEATRRQELELADKQANQEETQATIRQGDQNQDEYVRRTRPLMARQSWQATAIYVFTMSLLQAFGHGSGADFEMAMMMLTPSLAYLGLRTLDGWAPYSKASGHKVQSAVTAGIGKLMSRAG